MTDWEDDRRVGIPVDPDPADIRHADQPVTPDPAPADRPRIDVYVRNRNVLRESLRTEEIDDGVMVDWWTDERDGTEHVSGIEVLGARAVEINGMEAHESADLEAELEYLSGMLRGMARRAGNHRFRASQLEDTLADAYRDHRSTLSILCQAVGIAREGGHPQDRDRIRQKIGELREAFNHARVEIKDEEERGARLVATIDRRTDERDEAWSELARLRPVVDAAREYVDRPESGSLFDALVDRVAALDTTGEPQPYDWRVSNPAHIPFCDGSCDAGAMVCPEPRDD